MSTRTHRSPNVVGGLLGFAWLLVILVPLAVSLFVTRVAAPPAPSTPGVRDAT